jgi:hypothetical protein
MICKPEACAGVLPFNDSITATQTCHLPLNDFKDQLWSTGLGNGRHTFGSTFRNHNLGIPSGSKVQAESKLFHQSSEYLLEKNAISEDGGEMYIRATKLFYVTSPSSERTVSRNFTAQQKYS